LFASVCDENKHSGVSLEFNYYRPLDATNTLLLDHQEVNSMSIRPMMREEWRK